VGVTLLERASDHSSPSSDEDMSEASFTSTFPYAFMEWCLAEDKEILLLPYLWKEGIARCCRQEAAVWVRGPRCTDAHTLALHPSGTLLRTRCTLLCEFGWQAEPYASRSNRPWFPYRVSCAGNTHQYEYHTITFHWPSREYNICLAGGLSSCKTDLHELNQVFQLTLILKMYLLFVCYWQRKLNF
jgi:hypothetical protein